MLTRFHFLNCLQLLHQLGLQSRRTLICLSQLNLQLGTLFTLLRNNLLLQGNMLGCSIKFCLYCRQLLKSQRQLLFVQCAHVGYYHVSVS